MSRDDLTYARAMTMALRPTRRSLSPNEFFSDYVLRAYREWLDRPLDEYLAKVAVSHANILAERVWHHLKDTSPDKVFNSKSAGEYREALATRECSDAGLVRDVAEGFKHVTLSRRTRRVTSKDQTGIETMGYGQGGWGEGRYGGPEQLVVTLDDGTKRPLSAILKNVIEMWARILPTLS
jgi:hypothetical protein